MMRASILLAIAAASAMSGCAANNTKTLYHWGGYQSQLYASLKGEGDPAAELAALEAQAEKARASGAALPPGFRAHLGMLNLKLGHYDEARQMLEAEKAIFPESAQYMDFVMKSVSGKKS